MAQLIGGDFYQLDGDKNGALDKEELSGFVTSYLIGSPVGADVGVDPGAATGSTPENGSPSSDDAVTVPGATGHPEDAQPAPPAEDASGTSVAPAPVAAMPGAGDSAPMSEASRTQRLASAFEAALEILKNGSDSEGALAVVQTLYTDAQKILQTG